MRSQRLIGLQEIDVSLALRFVSPFQCRQHLRHRLRGTEQPLHFGHDRCQPNFGLREQTRKVVEGNSFLLRIARQLHSREQM